MSHVLLLDDETFVHQMVQHYIEKHFSTEFSAVTSADEALAFFEGIKPSVFLIDLNIGGEHGAGWLIDTLNEAGALASTTSIIYSSMSDATEVQEEYKAKGITHFFAKSTLINEVEKAQLTELLATVLPPKPE